ncbi:MAG: ABC transporter substrate-binding protein [Propionibacteriaceae bacterium]|jgi:oligopeptide transport system substrate-binding protein|nr:ABC transporter substrate-binding protein [Propionibacteriaceae bacterium]
MQTTTHGRSPSGRLKTIALTAALALGAGLTGCAGDSSDQPSGAADAYDPISVSASPPDGPLIPTDTEEQGRKTLVFVLFEGLVRVDETSGQVVNAVAESIETDDAVTWTIKVKAGQLFADGSAVTAASFVDAWNWGARIENVQKAAGDLAVIKGYDAVHPTAAGATAGAQELSGLKLIDELTFTIELTEAWSGFRAHLTSVVFSPLPQAFFDDVEAWKEHPFGNGPYQIRGEIDESTGTYVELNPNYTGVRQVHNTGLYYRYYTDPDAVYQDVLADNLDVGSASGAGLLTARADFGDRFVAGPGGPTQTLTFPLYDQFWGSANGLLVRQAISHAIDRQAIVDTIFAGLGSPAKDYTQIGLEGWSDSIPGNEVLDYDVELAKRLLEQAGGYPYADLKLYYNADGAHKDWIEAVANQLRENLGLNAIPGPITTFPQFLEQRDAHELDGPWRASEIPFNPSLDDMLRNVYSRTGGASSQSGWASDEYESLLAQGRSALTTDQAVAYFNQAQEVLFRDLPAIPLWYSYSSTIHSTRVTGVIIGPAGAFTSHLYERVAP